MLKAGKLRHKVSIQDLVNIPDSSGEVQDEYGEASRQWQEIASVWAAIEPLSGRDFIAADKENSEIKGKIIIRYRSDINSSMRIVHTSRNIIYKILAILPDKESGLEYLTLMVDQGAREYEETA